MQSAEVVAVWRWRVRQTALAKVRRGTRVSVSHGGTRVRAETASAGARKWRRLNFLARKLLWLERTDSGPPDVGVGEAAVQNRRRGSQCLRVLWLGVDA